MGNKNVDLEEQIQTGAKTVESLSEEKKQKVTEKKNAKKELDGVIADIKTNVSEELGSYDSTPILSTRRRLKAC